MSLSVETLAVARKYTDDSLAGAGAVAGVPCKIQSITAITGGNRITFLWTDNNGDDHTSAMDVMNGVDGEDGKGIQSVTVNAQDHLIITYTDGTTVDAGQIEIHSSVDSVNGQTGAVALDAEDVGALPDNTPIPSKTSDLTNDSGFATTSDVSTALADYTKTADLTTLLAAKQDTLTFDDAPTENSDNPVKSGGVYSANQTLMKVMGQNGAKNLIPYPYAETTKTQNGVTFTDNGDGTITVNGTASANTLFTISTVLADVLLNDNTTEYILSGCEGGGGATYKLVVDDISDYSIICNQFDNEADFTIASSHHGIRASIVVYSGQVMSNVIFKPMVRLASDTDSTYQPYAKTNKQLTDDAEALTNQANDMVNVLGAKNVLPFPYYAGSGTYNGVTITDNGDGSITLDGTCTGMSFFVFYGGRYSLAPTTFVKKNEDYIATLEVVSGSMAINSGTSRFVFRNYITNATSPFVDIFYEDNVIDTRSVKFTYEPTASYGTSLVWYEFNVGTTFNNWRIRPMIRPASITDDTYVPYAKTNLQLTQDSVDWDNFSEVGAVNYCNFNTISGTKKGYTFTNNNGVIHVTGSRATGETGNVDFRKDMTLKAGTYRVSGCPSGGGTTKWRLLIAINNSTQYAVDYGDGAVFTLAADSDDVKVYCTIMADYSDSVDMYYKPMITPVSYNGDYVPYAKTNRELTEKIDIVGNLFTTTTKVVDNITHGIATTIATLENLPIGIYVVSGQFNSDSTMSGGGLVQFASSGVIQNGASCSTMINQGFKANAGLTGIFNITNATNRINLQIYTANADLTVVSAKLAAIRIA